MLEIDSISKTFFPGTVNERRAISRLSLNLAAGDFVTVIGSNGAGKSTLLNIVSGAIRSDAGTVTIDGTNVTRLNEHRRARYLSRVFQDPMMGTAPHMTIEENLAMALARGRRRTLGRGVSPGKRSTFRHELASLGLGLEDRLKAPVGLLSGGQRQALSLLMATFSEPRILLLDEHTAALDPQRGAVIAKLTETSVKRYGLTTLMVTHNMEQALQLGNRLIMMHAGQIVVNLDPARKATMDVPGLLAEFEKIKGAQLGDSSLLR